MRDYTRVYLVGFSVICLILIFVVLSVPVRQSYVDDAIKSISANVSRQANADSTATAAILKRLTALETQQKDTLEKLSLLRKDTSSINATVAVVLPQLVSLNSQIATVSTEVKSVHENVNTFLGIVSSKADAVKIAEIYTQINNIQQTQSLLMTSIQNIGKYLNLSLVTGNVTN